VAGTRVPQHMRLCAHRRLAELIITCCRACPVSCSVAAVGELALLYDAPRAASVTAITEVRWQRRSHAAIRVALEAVEVRRWLIARSAARLVAPHLLCLRHLCSAWDR
jgi:hypothetical protein